MALAPLTVQQPRVSLIGGKELPKASGAGIQPPNLSGLQQLAADIAGKNDRNQALADELAGQAAGAGPVVRNPDGSYAGPKVDFSRSFAWNTGHLDAAVGNISAAIRTDTMDQFGRIQAEVDKPVDARVALMRERLAAVVETVPPSLRSRVLQEGSRDIDARSRQMSEEQVRKMEAADLAGIKGRIVSDSQEAASISMAGGDPRPQLERIYGAYDELVGKQEMSQENADRLKVSATRFIGAYATGEKIATAVRDGDVGLAELDEFIVALEQGGQATLTAEGEDTDDGRPGRKRRAVYDAAQLMQDWADPETVNLFANRLRELHGRMDRRLADYQDKMGVLDYLSGLRDEQPAISSMHGKIDKMVDEAITNGSHLDDPGKFQLMQLVRAGKYLPKPLSDTMISTLLSSDYSEAVRWLEFWNQTSKMTVKGRDIGAMVRNSMKSEDVAFLDAATEAAKQIAATGDTQAAQMDKWRQYQQKAKDPDNTVKKSIAAFNEALEPDQPTFGKRVAENFLAGYPGISMPFWMNRELELTYHILANMSGEPDRNKVFEDAWKMVAARHPASKVHAGGVQVGPPLTNPEGWSGGETEVFGVDVPQRGKASELHWLGSWGKDIFGDLKDSETLILDDSQSAILEQILMAGPMEGPGELWQLVDTGTSAQIPQFHVLLRDGTRLHVRNADGKSEPLVVDPGIARSVLESRGQYEAEKVRLEALAQGQLQDKALKQWELSHLGEGGGSVISGLFKRMTGRAPDLEFDPAGFYEWLDTQSPEFQAEMLSDHQQSVAGMRKQLDKAAQRLVPMPEGTDLGPLNLFDPRVAGTDVSIAAVQAIERILPDGTGGQFMLNLIATESDFGKAPGTFRLEGDRGLTQINTGPQGAFREIQRRIGIPGNKVAIAAEKLKMAGIDVGKLTVRDLDKPIIAVAMARLYMMVDPRPIPQDVQGQAALWKSHYNTWKGAGTEESFVKKANSYMMPKDEGGEPSFRSMTSSPLSGGSIVDISGKPDPANFRATRPSTQMAAQRLSAAFGKPLVVTPHGGTQPDSRSGTSQHHRGTALDFLIRDYTDFEKTQLIATAIALGYGGIGGYAAGDGKGTIHLDLRQGGNGPGQLGVWWRKVPGVDGNWSEGPAWFKDGITLGLKWRRQNG